MLPTGVATGGDRIGAEVWQPAGFAVLNLQHPGSDDSIWAERMRGVRRGAQADQYLARVADAHERLLRRRIDDLFAATAVAVIPLAVDIGAELRVHVVLALLFSAGNGFGRRGSPNE